ncbi:calaxin-like isoform X1 [Schistocerca gregaria]|uniref:calaxin-like isoform X1 n=1 Tax=Schistocerca gregaria TaxID=7010 RepID=UPI00211ED079|nr:calaxin-like isoform X1 [Schistocerca gregaria]
MPDTLNLPLTPEEEARFKRRYSDLIKKLVHTTRFSKDEVESLLVMHFKLERAGGPLGYERAAEVLYSLLGMTDELLTIRVCDLLDRENARRITMESWVVGLSLLLRGSFEERIQLCFKVYEELGTGFITKRAMFELLKRCIVAPPIGEELDDTVEFGVFAGHGAAGDEQDGPGPRRQDLVRGLPRVCDAGPADDAVSGALPTHTARRLQVPHHAEPQDLPILDARCGVCLAHCLQQILPHDSGHKHN